MNTFKLYGPPGTGKTTVLLDRAEELVTKYGRDRVGFFTFTRRAKQVAKDRGLDLPYLVTLHAMAYQLGHVCREEMVTPKKLAKWGEEAGVRLSDPGHLTDGFNDTTPGAFALHAWELIRNLDQSIYDFQHPAIGSEYLLQLVGSYEAWKHRNGLVDFTDLLLRGCRHGFLEPIYLPAMILDEAQDLTPLQWKFVLHVAQAAKTEVLWVAGDDDQSIYTWAGASAHLLNALPGSSQTLSQSYRLPLQVYALSARTIERVRDRKKKLFHPKKEVGRAVFAGGLPDLKEEKDVLVLARNQYLLRGIRRQLISEGIPFFGAGSPLDDEKRVRTYLALERLKAGGDVSARSARYLLRMLPAKGAKLTVQECREGYRYRAGDLHPGIANFSLKMAPGTLTYLRRAAPALLGGQKIKLSTVHQAKGDEAKHVIVLTDLSRSTAMAARGNEDDERRVVYVALTRASERLTILYPKTGLSWLGLGIL